MLNKSDCELLIKVFDFWNDLSPDERNTLSSNTTCISYKQGESVYNTDHKCLGALIVKRGELRTFILSETGKEITLYRLLPSDVCILSASCLISQITFDVHIEAEEDSEVLLVDLAVFSKLIEQNVLVENFSLKVAVDKFSDVMWTMEQILFLNFDRRLAIFLVDEASRTGSNDISLTHQQIAKYMGSAREVVSRMMKYFEKEGYVSCYRGGVKITNRFALQKLIR